MEYLNEEKRSELLNKSKHADNYVDQSKGKNRYARRVLSSVINSVAEYNAIDMDSFFKKDVLTVHIPIRGETNNYVVIIRVGGILHFVQDQLNSPDQQVDLRIITKAIIQAFNSDDVYIHCSCPDWQFRFSYWSRVNDISSDINNEQTNNGNYIVNPRDTKGRGCKHTLLVLSNTRWIRNVASVIYNYIRYMENHYQRLYADIIYPVIYGKDYEEPVQLQIDDSDELMSDTTDIDISNKEARTRGQFKPGNQSGLQFASNNTNDEKQFNFDSLMSD